MIRLITTLLTILVLSGCSALNIQDNNLPVSQKDFKCLVTNVYLEGRGLHNKEAWSMIAATALNRSNDWKHYHYGAKSPAICDIIKSKQYSSAQALNKPILEVEVFKKISKWLEHANWRRYKTTFYFESDKLRNMYFSRVWTKNNSNKIKLR